MEYLTFFYKSFQPLCPDSSSVCPVLMEQFHVLVVLTFVFPEIVTFLKTYFKLALTVKFDL